VGVPAHARRRSSPRAREGKTKEVRMGRGRTYRKKPSVSANESAGNVPPSFLRLLGGTKRGKEYKGGPEKKKKRERPCFVSLSHSTKGMVTEGRKEAEGGGEGAL